MYLHLTLELHYTRIARIRLKTVKETQLQICGFSLYRVN